MLPKLHATTAQGEGPVLFCLLWTAPPAVIPGQCPPSPARPPTRPPLPPTNFPAYSVAAYKDGAPYGGAAGTLSSNLPAEALDQETLSIVLGQGQRRCRWCWNPPPPPCAVLATRAASPFPARSTGRSFGESVHRSSLCWQASTSVSK